MSRHDLRHSPAAPRQAGSVIFVDGGAEAGEAAWRNVSSAYTATVLVDWQTLRHSWQVKPLGSLSSALLLRPDRNWGSREPGATPE